MMNQRILLLSSLRVAKVKSVEEEKDKGEVEPVQEHMTDVR